MPGIGAGFLSWLGVAILAAVVLDGLAKVVCAVMPRRKIKVSQRDALRIVEIDGATNGDVHTALAENTQKQQENVE